MSTDKTATVDIGPEGIRLGQLIKFVGAVDTGGEVKILLESGLVRVNGNVESRRGLQLRTGDIVAIAGRSWQLA